MNRFMIGQWGSFDYKKYERDFMPEFYGIEACLFGDESDTAHLVKEATEVGFLIGVHFPLRAGISPLRDAPFLSNDDAVREHAYDLVQQELEYVAAIKPAYVLFHYPKLVILDNRVDWKPWRFADSSEYEFENDYALEELKMRSKQLLTWLSGKAREYQFTAVLEFDALNRYVYEDDFLDQLLEEHKEIKLCLDTARLHLQDWIDPNFDSVAIVKRFAKYAEIIHLSNVQISADNVILKSRYPVLPSQSTSDGWAPTEQYLSTIRHENDRVKVMFEHNSTLVTDEELLDCYKWVNQILSENND
ncbi:sugar phosphate isomerase/epimerase [Paenibacillus sp. GSMTC-2017]|uniref:sugar phosphate isomerase/epimerase n=1 Tax=Paenibacillus sp. GSMTC-2017 TaxID=2794350 RepID=UPI0018D74DC8|nr:sugar phosphate isomerase/epimerase [Paenibacillus sp. GSMTC-2017]MBH5319879.1 sugar phosphate isomerase/epimerase [Paenibacillus sp. GSMTC-2017]